MTGHKKQYSLRNKNSAKQKTRLGASDYKQKSLRKLENSWKMKKKGGALRYHKIR